MAKYLYNNAGQITEMLATVISSGAPTAGAIPALDGTGKLDISTMPVGLGAETDQIVASEALSAGDFVNVWISTGVKVRRADASVSGKQAHGFVLAAVASAATATVYRVSQLNNQVTGCTIGSVEYLSASVPGGHQETAPTGTGQMVQKLGMASSATTIIFAPSEPIVLA